jgi:hypothetical protein
MLRHQRLPPSDLLLSWSVVSIAMGVWVYDLMAFVRMLVA